MEASSGGFDSHLPDYTASSSSGPGSRAFIPVGAGSNPADVTSPGMVPAGTIWDLYRIPWRGKAGSDPVDRSSNLWCGAKRSEWGRSPSWPLKPANRVRYPGSVLQAFEIPECRTRPRSSVGRAPVYEAGLSEVRVLPRVLSEGSRKVRRLGCVPNGAGSSPVSLPNLE